MKLRCYLARTVMASVCDETALPGWVERHVEQCEGCRAEAAALHNVRSLLREDVSEPDCPVEWKRVRAALREPVAIRRPVRRLAGAAACAVIALAAVAFWMLSAPEPRQEGASRHARVAKVSQPPPEREREALKQKQSPRVIKPTLQKTGDKVVREKPVKRSAPRYRKRVLPPHRLMVKRGPPVQPERKELEAPRIVAVAPEEHVIDVVGVSVDRRDECAYVIREVSAEVDGQAPGVNL